MQVVVKLHPYPRRKERSPDYTGVMDIEIDGQWKSVMVSMWKQGASFNLRGGTRAETTKHTGVNSQPASRLDHIRSEIAQGHPGLKKYT